MKYWTIFLTLFSIPLFSQSLEETEAELQRLGLASMRRELAEDRTATADTFKNILLDILSVKEGAQYAWKKVETMSIMAPEDGSVKLFTWMVPQKNARYSYHGILVDLTEKKPKVFELEDGFIDIEQPEATLLRTSKWYGALYYHLEDFYDKKQKKHFYILLGYRPIDERITQKIVDVLHFDGGKWRFGGEIFDVPRFNDKRFARPPYRLTMTYSARSTAMLRWDSKEKRIIMDRVNPPDASQKGMYMHYSPDFSYDALELKEGKWVLVENVIVDSDVITPPRQQSFQSGLGPQK